MHRTIIVTADGSNTIHLPEWDEQYHSKHGAIQEAYHVFIKHGLYYLTNQKTREKKEAPISILEIGFGTGLNAYITLLESQKAGFNIDYCGVEAYPVLPKEMEALNYSKLIENPFADNLFSELHQVSWNKKHSITNQFSIIKQQKLFQDIDEDKAFDMVYFDAFGARVQPELWTEAIFQRMYAALKPNGVLVTYAAKGSVRRAMQHVGFTVEKLPGPPGKREMLRALK